MLGKKVLGGGLAKRKLKDGRVLWKSALQEEMGKEIKLLEFKYNITISSHPKKTELKLCLNVE